MKKYLSHILIALFALGIGYFGGTREPTHFGDAVDPAILQDALDDKTAVLSDYLTDEIRLKEIPEIDLSVVTPEEVSEAYVQTAQEKGITVDVNDGPTDLYPKIQTKIAEANQLCSDPTSNH